MDKEIIWIFEDRGESALSRLFKSAYMKECQDYILYVGGNGRLKKAAAEYLKKDYIVILFIDMPPGNKSIRKIYYNLGQLTKRYDNLYIMPWICSEYYYLMSLAMVKSQVFYNKVLYSSCVPDDEDFPKELLDFYSNKVDIPRNLELMKLCLQKCDFMNIPGYENIKYYEQFCKRIAWDVLPDCAIPVDLVPKDFRRYLHNFIFDPYITGDCPCKAEECKKSGQICNFNPEKCGCSGELLLDKAIAYARAMPCFPTGTIGNEDLKKTDVIGLKDLHKILVDNYNSFSDELASKDHRDLPDVRYGHIPYLYEYEETTE